MSTTKVALIRLGYQDYAIPANRVAELVSMLGELRKLESTYVAGEGQIYWHDATKDDEQTITLIPASRIRDAKPEEPPKPPPAPVKPADGRVIAEPTSAEPICITSVPPMREFVDEFRHEDFPA